MSDVAIDRLNLQISNASGQEHRIQGITAMAVAMIGEELVHLGRSHVAREPVRVDAVSAQPAAVDLRRSDDATCARALAMSVMQAIRLRVEE